jgi:hypothetical protein
VSGYTFLHILVFICHINNASNENIRAFEIRALRGIFGQKGDEVRMIEKTTKG